MALATRTGLWQRDRSGGVLGHEGGAHCRRAAAQAAASGEDPGRILNSKWEFGMGGEAGARGPARVEPFGWPFRTPQCMHEVAPTDLQQFEWSSSWSLSSFIIIIIIMRRRCLSSLPPARAWTTAPARRQQEQEKKIITWKDTDVYICIHVYIYTYIYAYTMLHICAYTHVFGVDAVLSTASAPFEPQRIGCMMAVLC